MEQKKKAAVANGNELTDAKILSSCDSHSISGSRHQDCCGSTI